MMNERGETTGGSVGGVVAVIVVIAFCVLFVGSLWSLNRPGPTQVNLIRNGGWLDDKSIREVRAPNSTYAVSGLYSESRSYIAGSEQRFYKLTSDPSLGEQGGFDFVQVPTKDGVNVKLDAQILFRTAFTDPQGNLTDESEDLLRRFDTQFGNRNFTDQDGDGSKVWDGNTGWNAFLNTIFRPVVENAFREQIGSVNCADLVSSCALVQSSQQQQLANFTAQDNQENFERIQAESEARIEAGMRSALGDEYLRDFSVQLTKVTLPNQVQAAIDEAQSSFAEIAKARAQNVQSKYQAEANLRIAKSLQASPELVQLKAAEALKDSNATVILGNPGTGLVIGK